MVTIYSWFLSLEMLPQVISLENHLAVHETLVYFSTTTYCYHLLHLLLMTYGGFNHLSPWRPLRLFVISRLVLRLTSCRFSPVCHQTPVTDPESGCTFQSLQVLPHHSIPVFLPLASNSSSY